MASGMVLAQQHESITTTPEQTTAQEPSSTEPPSYTVVELGTLGGSGSVAHEINDAGQVVGYSTAEDVHGYYHAFLYQDGQMTDLGTLGGLEGSSMAEGINGAGQVVGWSDTTSGDQHAFLYQDGQMIHLGTLGGSWSMGRNINEASQVVGSSDTTSGDSHAFLYQDGQMTDLNTLIPPDSGWVLSEAQDINDKGQIVGQGYKGNVGYRAFLLTPADTKPPTTLPSATTADGSIYNSGEWTNQNVTLTLTASDEGGSGVDKIFYNTDGSTTYQEYTAPLSVTDEGTTTVSYYATDKSGNQGEAETFTIKVDKTAPTVKAVVPTNGATGVLRATDVVATFSEEMDPATLSKATFKLYKGKTEITGVTVTPSADGMQATLKPNTQLEKNTTYQAVVTTGVKDLAGNALDQNRKAKGNQQMTWSFRTGTI